MRFSMRIRDFAEFTGVSVRTLHHYDKIGLLEPAYIDEENGYRYYNQDSLVKMQEIMFYRELDFPLKEIGLLMNSPDYDRFEALNDQKKLLIIKMERLERLILAIDDAIRGENIMKKFNTVEFDLYKDEVKEKWGNTEAYAEYAEKTKNNSTAKNNEMLREMDGRIGMFAFCKERGTPYDDPAIMCIVEEFRQFISMNFYSCNKEILTGLGKMYVEDPRFKKNIDKHGEGTAEYISKAIEAYCEKK